MDIQVFSDPGCGSAWLEHLVWDQGVAGSNPVTPILTNMREWLSWLERRPVTAKVVGSSPIWVVA